MGQQVLHRQGSPIVTMSRSSWLAGGRLGWRSGSLGTSRSSVPDSGGRRFTELRENGWSWLLEGERLDHIMTSAIVDVGHIVTTHALAVGDLDLANSRRASRSELRHTTRSPNSTWSKSDVQAATNRAPMRTSARTSSTAATTASGRSSFRSGHPESSTTRAGCHREPGVRGSPHR
jgi:hypothetical protein